MFVAGVEDAAKLVVAPDERVALVNQKGRTHFFDDAEEGGGADVGGNDRAIDDFGEDGEQGGFAAALFGGFEADVGGDVAEVKGVGVEDPEGEGFSGPFGEDDEAGQKGGELVQDGGCIADS